jgi:hypothetical protein
VYVAGPTSEYWYPYVLGSATPFNVALTFIVPVVGGAGVPVPVREII